MGSYALTFNEAEALLENIYVVEPVDEDVIPTVVKHKKKKGKRKEYLSSLPVETISHTLSEEELTDIFGENGWKQLPDETYMRVKVEPAKYTVEEHHICVYAGKTTDKIVKAFRLKAIPKEQRDKAKGTVAHETLERIAGIKHMDNQLAELSAEERYRKRQLLVRPLVEDLFSWLKKVRDEEMVPEGGKTMKGVNYYLNHEKQFCEFLNHGNVPLDNNATESALRNFCMHKHTWRLIDTINGAKASALVYSIVETAKANGLNPFRYLEFLLTEMMEHEEDTDYCFIDDLLPWSDSIPDICKMKNKKEH